MTTNIPTVTNNDLYTYLDAYLAPITPTLEERKDSDDIHTTITLTLTLYDDGYIEVSNGEKCLLVGNTDI